MGQKINIRAGFVHLHSGQQECGIAYWDGNRALWFPCSKLLNHQGRCGYADNTAF